ncbi:putative HNHc nuclease, partial [Staphylococcus haemolyticus]|nr:putative HNHc nuclease [Staphylococcus haemolyticus]
FDEHMAHVVHRLPSMSLYVLYKRKYLTALFVGNSERVYDLHISLSDCTRTQASQIIEVTLDWIFHNDIPLAYKTSDLLKQDKA